MLSYAAQGGFLDGVTYLLEKHPDLAFLNDEDGSYPIHRACSSGNLHIVKKFISSFPHMKSVLNQKDQNILHIAAETGHDAIVRYLLGKKTNGMKSFVNVKDFEGNTPLHLAAFGKHLRVVYELTKCEAVDLEAQNNRQFTALDLAEKNDKEPTLNEVCSLLFIIINSMLVYLACKYNYKKAINYDAYMILLFDQLCSA